MDSYHYWGQDTQFSSSADDLLASGADELDQRILRALLTCPLDDPFNPAYGACIGRYVGQALTPEKRAEISAAALQILVTEPDVQQIPAPVVSLTADTANSFDSLTVAYVYAPTGQPRAITAP